MMMMLKFVLAACQGAESRRLDRPRAQISTSSSSHYHHHLIISLWTNCDEILHVGFCRVQKCTCKKSAFYLHFEIFTIFILVITIRKSSCHHHYRFFILPFYWPIVMKFCMWGSVGYRNAHAKNQPSTCILKFSLYFYKAPMSPIA